MPYNRTLDLLEYELRQLKARDVRIEAGYNLASLRNDGWPRGGTRPSHPGVVLYFTGVDGDMCFPAGAYSRMEDNLHGIALTLECLRAVDRYGVTMAHEQYRGFLALPPARSASEAWTIDSAVAWLALRTGRTESSLLENRATYREAYRAAAARMHPDNPAGSVDQFAVLQAVSGLLDEHFKLREASA